MFTNRLQHLLRKKVPPPPPSFGMLFSQIAHGGSESDGYQASSQLNNTAKEIPNPACRRTKMVITIMVIKKMGEKKKKKKGMRGGKGRVVTFFFHEEVVWKSCNTANSDSSASRRQMSQGSLFLGIKFSQLLS